jgi:exonuclease SbcC
LERNPRYERPKKTGEGFTTENADATLKLPNGDIVTGYYPVLAKIVDILGITYGQFKQISMIAQGEFLQLLLADSKDRGVIFRRVFNTELYQTVQKILKERESEARRQCEDSDQRILQYIEGISCPEDEESKVLSELCKSASIHNASDILKELHAFLQRDRAVRETAKKQADELAKQHLQQVSSLTQASFINQTFKNLEVARNRKQELLVSLDANNKREGALQDAELALHSLKPLEDSHEKALHEVQGLLSGIEKTEASLTLQNQQMEILLKKYTEESEKEPIRITLASRIEQLTLSLPQYEKMEEKQKNLETLTSRQSEKKQFLETLENDREGLEKKKETLQSLLLEKEQVEIQLSLCTQEKERLKTHRTRLLALQATQKIWENRQKEYAQYQENYLLLEKAFKESNSHFLAAETLFFREQAGILALQLKDGEPCPVCGSPLHPNKAKVLSEAPSEATLQQLKQACELDRGVLQAESERMSSKKTEVSESQTLVTTLARELVFQSEEECKLSALAALVASKLEMIDIQQRENSETYGKLQTQEAEKRQLKELYAQVELALAEKGKEIIQQGQELNLLNSFLATLTGELTTMRQALEYPDIHKVATVISEQQFVLDALKKSFKASEDAYLACKESLHSYQILLADQKSRLETAQKAENEASERFLKHVLESGFVDINTYHAALKTESEIKELKISIENYRDALKANQQDLQRLEQETKGLVPQDLDAIEREKIELERQQRQLEELLQKVSSRLVINEKVSSSLTKELAEIKTIRKNYLVVSNLSKTASGELSGKQKLAFEQYVQAYYFNQILNEANKRLKIMANGRFALLRKEEATNLKSQTGLEIVVLDHYTGRVRSVKSLSGGESFKASLSLALGLSDVIQSYAGGVEIDTLFIDEGFGALDTESLEQAIQTLVGLSEGNRLVGIISHVSEPKERLDRQIIVSKSHLGSSVTVKA